MTTLEEKIKQHDELRELVAGDPYVMRAYVAEPDATREAEPGTPMKFVATTSGVKRDGLDLRIDGIELKNFERNPVFLWVHSYSMPPLGKVVKIKRFKNKIEMTVLFDQGDEFAVEIERKYREGFLTAVSIGWIILEFERAEEDAEARYIILRSDLLDLSAVPVPGDPDALLPGREIKAMRDLALYSETLRDNQDHAAVDDQQCTYCRGWFPKPVELHHAERECKRLRDSQDVSHFALASSSARTTLVSNELLDDFADRLGLRRDGAEFIEINNPSCIHEDDGEADWTRVATEMVRLFVDGAGKYLPGDERIQAYRHLARHYRKLGKTPPELLETARLDAIEVRDLFVEDEWATYLGERMDVATERLRAAAVEMRDAADEILNIIEGDGDSDDDGAYIAFESIRNALPTTEREGDKDAS